jgi:hypothetical protein
MDTRFERGPREVNNNDGGIREITGRQVDLRVVRETEDRILAYQMRTEPEISRLIWELDREWSIERTLEASASALALIGMLLGAILSRWWLLLSGIAAAFLLEHALQGWCPAIPLLRGLGFRTSKEINREKYALKVLRGDFEGIQRPSDLADAESLARRVFRAVS